eukprot:3163758-Alexandrium_andersonii.AAC.1
MRGMAAALRATVGREACMVHEDWFATTVALSQLGYRPAPREPGHNDGWHSNDAESGITSVRGTAPSRRATGGRTNGL